jgi:hypothetical protein
MLRLKRNAISFFPAVVLLFAGCVSADLRGFYALDLRSAKVPVMLNKQAAAPAGRDITALASESTAGTQIQYETEDAYGVWNVTTTITFTDKTKVPLGKQLIAQLKSGDALLRVHQIDFSFHNLLAPYYGESEMFQKVYASVYGKTK